MMNKSRLTLIGIIAVFAAPLLAAIYLNSAWSDWRPPTTGNRGQLLAPVVPLSETVNRELAADGQWVLLQILPAAGEAAGEADAIVDGTAQVTADALNNVRRALGRRQDQLAIRAMTPADLGVAPAVPGDIYLRDPAGNLMMAYRGTHSMSDIRQDLNRLLKGADQGRSD